MLYIIFSIYLFLFGLFLSLLGLYFVNYDIHIYMDWEFVMMNSMVYCMSLIFDYMSLIFMGCVLIISSMVVFYSHSYMENDIYKFRFLYLVFMFILSMMFMIISPNMMSILLGWDGLGLVSYILVTYFQNYNSYNSGMLTIMSNRIGDVAILMCIAWMMNFGSWNFMYYVGFYEPYMLNIVILSFIASITKSAQIPFSSWLPAAMAAPTPVSALVHSSTLVTAGVYLMIRFSPLMMSFNTDFMLILSMMTMFMSGLGANYEFDFKKIIALSTLSQLGLMMSVLFLGFPKLAFFHLLSHAFFKALLFLCAGLIIHSMNNTQDIREMGCVFFLLPYTSSCFVISSLSLCGFPFLSGFYSKDLIVEYMMMSCNNFFVFMIFMISISLTVSYSIRLMNYLMFKGVGNYSFQSYYEDIYMMFSMILLSFFSIFFGSVLTWIMFKTPMIIMLPFYLKYMTIFFMFFGVLLGFIMCNFSIYYMNGLSLYLLYFMGSMWFMPLFSTVGFSSVFLKGSFYYMNMMDMGWGEYLFSRSYIMYMYIMSNMNYFLEKNNIKLYMYSFLFLLIFMML